MIGLLAYSTAVETVHWFGFQNFNIDSSFSVIFGESRNQGWLHAVPLHACRVTWLMRDTASPKIRGEAEIPYKQAADVLFTAALRWMSDFGTLVHSIQNSKSRVGCSFFLPLALPNSLDSGLCFFFKLNEWSYFSHILSAVWVTFYLI